MRNITGKVIDEQQLVLYLIYGSRYKCKVSIAINVQKRSTFRKVLRAKEWWLLQNIVLSTDLVLIKKTQHLPQKKKITEPWLEKLLKSCIVRMSGSNPDGHILHIGTIYHVLSSDDK